MVPYLDPLPHYEATQPGNMLRIFELGGRLAADTAIPNPFDTNGKPGAKVSIRGVGTQNRTDPVFVSLTKTRLLDPTLNFLGTNDHPGDYRSSGCTACHVIYANDRSPVHSGPYAAAGHLGLSLNPDPTIPKDETGHPIEHKFVTGIPSSQCIVCHVHPGTNVMNSYTGYIWWDEETDGELMYPREQRHPSSEEYLQAQMSNPDETAARGLWSDPRFLERVADLNPQARHTQFADFHGHGWVFRAVFKKDRKGEPYRPRRPHGQRQCRHRTAPGRHRHAHLPERTEPEVQTPGPGPSPSPHAPQPRRPPRPPARHPPRKGDAPGIDCHFGCRTSTATQVAPAGSPRRHRDPVPHRLPRHRR